MTQNDFFLWFRKLNCKSLVWRFHKHKDGVAPLAPSCSCHTKAHLWSLELGGSFQRPPSSLGPAGHNCPEERALSWADGSTVTAPHRGRKRFPLTSPFCYTDPAGAGRARSGVGQERRGAGGGRRFGRDWRVATHMQHKCTLTCMLWLTFPYTRPLRHNCSCLYLCAPLPWWGCLAVRHSLLLSHPCGSLCLVLWVCHTFLALSLRVKNRKGRNSCSSYLSLSIDWLRAPP